MKHTIWTLSLIAILLASCAPVDLNAPVPVYTTGVDPQAWSLIPAGEFLSGQFNHPVTIENDYEMMVTPVTVAQYVDFLNQAMANGTLTIAADQIVGFYPGDEFRGVNHEVEITPGDYINVPFSDPASRFSYDGTTFSVNAGWEHHPMTNVSWFGAWSYCGAHDYRLPTEMEWEKAARGTDGRPFPWGDEIARNNANFYASRDPFEDMGSFGSRTSPVGFYNGGTYDGYVTLASASPYGLYDMAGNVWQWMADVYEGQHYRYMRGGSKDTYEMDLRAWVRNNAAPVYYSPGVGFRCVRNP
ncbi:MAG: SUMF1/EgtB/PvdO family nonheme iron enzyme [Chloroflexota bacterium]